MLHHQLLGDGAKPKGGKGDKNSNVGDSIQSVTPLVSGSVNIGGFFTAGNKFAVTATVALNPAVIPIPPVTVSEGVEVNSKS